MRTIGIAVLTACWSVGMSAQGTDVLVHSSQHPQTETSIAIDPNNPGRLFLAANGRFATGPTQVQVCWFFSSDTGRTWQGGEDSPNGERLGGDPVAFFDNNGNAYLAAMDRNGAWGSPYNRVLLFKTTNAGASWSGPVVAGTGGSNPDVNGIDKPYAAADLSGVYPTNVYVAWTKIEKDYGSSEISKDGMFARSTDGGATFGDSVVLYNGYSATGWGAHITTGPEGEVYVAWVRWSGFDRPETFVVCRRSTDGGATFEPQTSFPISGIGAAGNTGQPEFNDTRAATVPCLAVDRTGGARRGWVYVVYADRGTGDSDSLLRRSTDGGSTWISPVRVNQDAQGNGHPQWFPSLAVDPVYGYVAVSYYSMDSPPATRRYVALSTDGGTTFVRNIPVSDVSFIPSAVPGFAPGYMGDYYETAFNGEHVIASWSDNRSGVHKAYVDRLPLRFQLTLNQQFSTGLPVGSIGRWTGSSFGQQINSGEGAEVLIGSMETFQAEDDLLPNPQTSALEKFHRWIGLPDSRNHRTFDINGNTDQITAALLPTDAGVSIGVGLLDGAIASSANTVFFRDPWYYDFQDPNFPGTWRSGGMDESLLQSRSTGTSGFHPDLTSVFSGSPFPYRGVFLNQPIESGKPYYSVGAPETQSIGGWESHFVDWHGNLAALQSPGNTTTGVVFNAANATVTARYKAHLGSSVSSASGSNSQRVVVSHEQEARICYMAYESAGEVWYSRSADGGTTWDPEIRLSDGTGASGAPAIAVWTGNAGGEGSIPLQLDVHVLYRKRTGNDYQIVRREFRH